MGGIKLRAVWAPLAVAWLLGCSPPRVCTTVPDDQQGSFMVPMPAHATVQALIDPAFSNRERAEIADALGVWNRYSAQSLGRQFFAPRLAMVPEGAQPRMPRDCGFAGPGAAAFHIVLVDSEREWSDLGLGPSNPGVTIRCHDGNALRKQIVLINARNADLGQFKSVVLHELGHAIGLDHSCSPDGGRPDFVSCDQVSYPGHPYFDALMYPVLRSSSGSSMRHGEIKEELRENDLQRADCLYKPS